MTPRGKRFLFGCLGGCGALVLMLVGGCVAITAWIKSPGQLLDPQTLLDADSVGHLEWRLDLENPGTAAIVEAALAALDSRNDAFGESGVMRWVIGYNQRRQERQLRDLFPATAVWSLHPHPEDDGDVSLYSVSVQRLGHQVQLWDWASGWFARFSDLPAERYRGETIFMLGGAGAQEEPAGAGFHAFLHPQGVFFADNLEAAKRGVDRLADGRREGAGPSELQRRFAELPTDASLRGVVVNRRGEVARLAQRFAEDEDGVDADLAAALEGVEAVALSGGATAAGDLVLEVLVSGADARLEERVRDLVDKLRESMDERDHPLEGGVRRSDRGLEIELRLVDAASAIRELGPGALSFELEPTGPVEDPDA